MNHIVARFHLIKMINHLSPKDRQRYNDLFQKLDTNADGKIDVHDLVNLFEKQKEGGNDSISSQVNVSSPTMHSSLNRAKKLMSKSSQTENGKLSFHDFVHYMIEQENKLEIVFKGIDADNDSNII